MTKETYQSIVIGISTGIISSIIVSLIFKCFEIYRNTRLYLLSIMRYMHEVSGAEFFHADNPDLFWKKIYNRPSEPGIVHISKKYKPELKTYNEKQEAIELTYRNYLVCLGNNDNLGQAEYHKELQDILFQYQDSANRIARHLKLIK